MFTPFSRKNKIINKTMNKQYTVVAAFQARFGKEAALREALVKLLVPTRLEEGCEADPIPRPKVL